MHFLLELIATITIAYLALKIFLSSVRAALILLVSKRELKISVEIEKGQEFHCATMRNERTLESLILTSLRQIVAKMKERQKVFSFMKTMTAKLGENAQKKNAPSISFFAQEVTKYYLSECEYKRVFLANSLLLVCESYAKSLVDRKERFFIGLLVRSCAFFLKSYYQFRYFLLNRELKKVNAMVADEEAREEKEKLMQNKSNRVLRQLIEDRQKEKDVPEMNIRPWDNFRIKD